MTDHIFNTVAAKAKDCLIFDKLGNTPSHITVYRHPDFYRIYGLKVTFKTDLQLFPNLFSKYRKAQTATAKPKSRTGELFIKSSEGEFKRVGDVVNLSFDMGDLSYE